MSDALAHWLKTQVRFSGLIGAGLVVPGGAPLIHSCSPDLPDESLQPLFAEIAEIAKTVTAEYPAASRLRWVFEDSHCHLIPHQKGMCLVLLTTGEPQSP